MPVTRHPPHRSVHKGLPHTAPASGCDAKPLEFRGITYSVKSDQCFILSLSIGCSRHIQNFPWPAAFPPASPPLVAQFCSRPSQVLRRCPTPQQRTCQDYTPQAFPDRPAQTKTGTVAISRFSCIECPRMLRVSDSAGPTCDSLSSVSCRVAFPHVVQGRHPKRVISKLNGWPALPPVNASRATSRLPAHDSGPQWSGFSFHVGLFHPLLYAGLSRRFHNVPNFSILICAFCNVPKLCPSKSIISKWFHCFRSC